MKTAYFLIIAILVQVLFANYALAAKIYDCTHYWKDDHGSFIKSGLETGVDVGISPYKNLGGKYTCSLELTKNDILKGRYVYFGEVGDAAYVYAMSEGKESGKVPFTHGLSPDFTSSPHYLRVLPLYVPLANLYDGDGKYELQLVYQDIIAGQAGIRNGFPSIESFNGVLRRSISDSIALTYHIFQTVCLLVIFIGFIFFSGSPIKQRLTISLTTLLAAGTIFSVTAIPRIIANDPNTAIRFNDFFHIFSFSFLFFPLLLVTESRTELKPKHIIIGQTLTSTLFSIANFIVFFDFSNSIYLKVYPSILLIQGGLIPLFISYLFKKNIFFTKYGPRQSKTAPYILAFLSLLVCWDIGINVLVLTMKVPFFLLHFAFLLPGILWQSRIFVIEAINIRNFPTQVNHIKNFALMEIASDFNKHLIFNGALEKLALLVNSKRVSLLEISETKISFFGAFGEYSNLSHGAFMTSDSEIRKAFEFFKINTEKIFYDGVSTVNQDLFGSYFCIIPLRVKNQIKCFLCLSEFENNIFPPFIKERISDIISELEIILTLLFTERDNRSQAIIVQTARLRVHPLQLQSERYFLENFDISHFVHQPAFLMGDLVDSTPLNRIYGATKIGKTMDLFLEHLYERNRHHGLIISRRNGDEIAIIVPNQEKDLTPDDALLRLYEIVKDIVSGDILKEVSKESGIVLPFQFKCVASQADAKLTNEENLQAVPSFTLLTDSEIDASSRVLSKIALRGECIFMERSGNRLKDLVNLIKLPKDRLRGIPTSQELFLVVHNSSMKAG